VSIVSIYIFALIAAFIEHSAICLREMWRMSGKLIHTIGIKVYSKTNLSTTIPSIIDLYRKVYS